MLLLNNKRDLLAFVHIEKAAGTTLIHILRHNFFIRYCDVRPFREQSKDLFHARDMQMTLLVNPFIECIAGHSVRPFGDLQERFANVHYITLLRDPIRRYVSRYQYFVERMGKQMSFDKFLKLKEANFQIKKITGTDDLGLAKAILTNRFFLVGVMERFDEFLMILKRKLEPKVFDPRYEIKNVAMDQRTSQHLLETYRDQIIENNRIDVELYQYVTEELIPKEREAYGPNLEKDVDDFKRLNKRGPIMAKRQIDYLFRKLYYEPVTGFIRRIKGLPAKGSYALH